MAVTVTDDDKKGITVTPSSVTVHENGGDATYGIKLNSEPTDEMTVLVASNDENAATVSGTTLTAEFTACIYRTQLERGTDRYRDRRGRRSGQHR